MKYRELESDGNGVRVEFKIEEGDMYEPYSHLNNTGFIDCFEMCRGILQRKCGIADEDVSRRGMKFVISEYRNVKFYEEVSSGEVVEVHSSLVYSGRIRFFIRHRMYRDGELVARGETGHCFKEGKKPIIPPGDLIERLMSLGIVVEV